MALSHVIFIKNIGSYARSKIHYQTIKNKLIDFLNNSEKTLLEEQSQILKENKSKIKIIGSDINERK